MEKVSWDDYFMTMVYLSAMRSKDESTHIGAVIIGPDHEIRSTGYNSFPRDIDDNVPERQKRPEKYFWFAHAERNAIYNTAMVGGGGLKGCRMYTNGVPCNDCAWGIINSGIVEVIVDKEWDANNAEKWSEHAKRTVVMFKEAGVHLSFWEGGLLDIHKFRRGEKF